MIRSSQPSTPSSAITPIDLRSRHMTGFTILEMLVAMLVGGVVMAGVFTGVFSSRNLMQTDVSRTNANQNLRDVMDLLSTELRQSGQSLQGVVPALSLSSTGSDATGWNSSITAWRSPVGEYLIACEAVAGSPTTVALQSTVAAVITSYQGCTGSGQEAVRTQWADYLTKHPNARLYVYDPVAKVGNMINITAANSASITVTGALTNTFPVNVNPRLYLIETRTFSRNGTTLMVSRDGGTDERMAPNITSLKFSVQTCTTAVTPVCSWANDFTPSSTNLWTAVSGIKVALEGQENINGKVAKRTLTSDIFPRNTLNAN
jgi:prepilin-type N-terminal cleavage/methylation domain-containing protein